MLSLSALTSSRGVFSVIGRNFSHYRIIEKLGQGGMGEVFLAEDSSLHRKVALKFLPPERQRDTAARKRLLREARSAAALNHPYICSIHEVGESENQDYIVMEYVEGQSLKERLEKGRPAAEEVLSVGIEVAEALEEAHGKGIVHRDIKPGNIMLTRTGHAKVMDFGLARQNLAEAAAADQDTETELTQRGMVVGTLAYMSPEQLRGQTADERSDLWALGVTLYEMAAGARPFLGQSGFEISSAILNQPPRPLPPGVPSELGAVIGRCLEKDPEKRYQRDAELRASLEAVRAGTVSFREAWRNRLTRNHRRVAAVVLVILLLLAGILVALDPGGLRGWITGEMGFPAQAIRIAVLPFANMTGDPEQEYLSDGLTQEMIVQLGRLAPQRLIVIARTSAMLYKKTEKSVAQIGQELGVGFILEGSARRDGGRIRVTAELIKVLDQTQLWAESYEREMAGILVLQSEVARKVAGALALKLFPTEQARLANVRTVNPEAYDAYLKGSHLWPKMTKADLDTAQQYFELALAKDPNYALAYVGIAMVWSCRNQSGMATPGEAVPKIVSAARQALQLDPDMGEAHYVLALSGTWHDWNWPAAELEWNRTFERNPDLAEARALYSHYLNILGRPREAMVHIDRALELDPLNTLFKTLYGVDLLFLRRYDDAIEQFRLALQAEPGQPVALNNLWFALALKGMEQDSYSTARTYIMGTYGSPKVAEAFDRGLAKGGPRAGYQLAAEALVAGMPEAFASPFDIASLFVGAGDKANALLWLEKGFELRDPNMPYIGRMPYFDPIRTEPRFQELVRRLNLPQ